MLLPFAYVGPQCSARKLFLPPECSVPSVNDDIFIDSIQLNKYGCDAICSAGCTCGPSVVWMPFTGRQSSSNLRQYNMPCFTFVWCLKILYEPSKILRPDSLVHCSQLE